MTDTVVIGAGPAGLTAAYELAKKGKKSLIFEQADKVGGISRTETYRGYRFDIGGHRFFTKVGEVQQIWKEILGDEFIQVPRLSRIYYRGKFFDYPLSIASTLSNLGVTDSSLIILSYLKSRFKSKLHPGSEAENLEEWVIERFGGRLYRTFFKSYTEKVWGIPCDKIQAEWAAQRIQGLSLKKAVINAMFGSNDTKTLIKAFDYPIYGPGMMWERCQQILESKGTPVHMKTRVTKIEHDGKRILRVIAEKEGEVIEVSAENFVSSMPITALARCLNPAPPDSVINAAKGLKYRDFLIVPLVINLKDIFPDNWIYIHSPEFKVGRIQNFKNWSAAMVPDASKTCVGMEYFCSEGDRLWEMSDKDLIAQAAEEIVGLGLVPDTKYIEDGTVIRQKKAYPVYDGMYREHLDVIQTYLQQFENLQTIGRNGMHRYNNQDHSMLTGLLAAKNILGETHDLWNVNVERSYHEEFTKEQWNDATKVLKPREEPVEAYAGSV
ncbi:MAG: Protoporphyrinogen oxidase [Phormidesmis priestleyi Ana]|uniref:Protoporphyrinogen oxidase n=1 Tax=Phormidesmis priestleyi Ana TaxID=1666911 RepID=A0A0P7ZSN4_9CYAN|nr:MAG: Protoporphyrinogen oxidase [Phormidesmis priestleyi Ana]